MDTDCREQVLVNETRTEVKGSLLAAFALALVTAFVAAEYWDRAPAEGLRLWLGAMAALLIAWVVAWIGFVLRPPSDREILTRWIPGARAGMMLCNLITAASVWLFLPVSGPELRALMLVLYAWYLIIQFAAATEATQVLASAVVMVLGSLIAWLIVAAPPYRTELVLFLPVFGATLIAVRRFVRRAVVEATAARAVAEQARRELDAALAVVARERDAKTHFIRAASHDLQQPLQAAALFLDRVRPGGRAAEQAPAIGALRQALTAARALVAAMLEHLKLEGGVIRPSIEPVALRDVFGRVLLTQEPPAVAAGVRLATVGGSHTVLADAALLARAIENLVANAIRHSEGRRVLLGARVRGAEVWIWVTDDGRGLAEADEARIFSPFEQGAHVGSAGGFGLGLASTRNLLELMDGSCGIAPSVGKGAAFYLRLPGADIEGADVRCAA